MTISLTESSRNQSQWLAVQNQIARLQKPTQADLLPIQEVIREGFDENFATESAGGRAWRQLSPVTVTERLLLGFPGAHPILERTGNYHASFADPVNADHVSVIEFGLGLTRLFEGSEDDRVRELEPNRPVLEMSTGATRRIEESIIEMVDELLHGR